MRVWVISLLIATACGGHRVVNEPAQPAPPRPVRCPVSALRNGLVVAEWASTDKMNMEAMLTGGPIGVVLEGCELRILTSCHMVGRYEWQWTPMTMDRVSVRNADELHGLMPLAAPSLASELQQSGDLTLQATVTGTVRVLATPKEAPQDAFCGPATHVISGINIGAFVMTAGMQPDGVTPRVIRYAGDANACAYSTLQAPAVGCRSPLRVYLTEIPGRVEPEPPPGTIRADFESTDKDVDIAVTHADNSSCISPCHLFIDPRRTIGLREENQKKVMSVSVPAATSVHLLIQPTNRDRHGPAIMMAMFGGMGAFAGLALVPIGLSDEDKRGMALGGAITLGVSAALVYAAWRLYKSAHPVVRVRPYVDHAMSSTGAGPPGAR